MTFLVSVVCFVAAALLAMVGIGCLIGAMIAIGRSNELAEQSVLDRERAEEMHVLAKDALANIELITRLGEEHDD